MKRNVNLSNDDMTSCSDKSIHRKLLNLTVYSLNKNDIRFFARKIQQESLPVGTRLQQRPPDVTSRGLEDPCTVRIHVRRQMGLGWGGRGVPVQ